MFFPYRFDRKFIGLWWPLGAREGVDGVTVTDQSFTASFGRARVETPLARRNRRARDPRLPMVEGSGYTSVLR